MEQKGKGEKAGREDFKRANPNGARIKLSYCNSCSIAEGPHLVPPTQPGMSSSPSNV